MRKTPANDRKKPAGVTISPAVIGRGAMVSSLLALLGCIILGIMIFVSDWSIEKLPAITTDLVLILCITAGALSAGRRATALGWLHGGLSGATFIALTVLAGYLLQGALDWRIVASRLVLGLVIGGVAGVIAVNWD